jgi:FkbM family methyltransferase
MRDLGTFAPRRPQKLHAPLLAMVLNAVHDHHEGRVTAVQVGANDGQLADPLWRRLRDDGWSGLLIEPHPAYVDTLRRLHDGNPRVRIVPCAISDTEGELPLYHLAPEAQARYPRWLRGCASLDEARFMTAFATAGTADRRPEDVAMTRVPLRRLDHVLAEHGTTRAEVLVVDVEGHELAVLRSFDLAALGLTAAVIECNGDSRADEPAYRAALIGAGLDVFRIGDDLVGLSRDVRLQVPLEELLAFFCKPDLADAAE